MHQNTQALTGTLFLVPTPLDFGCELETPTPIENLLPTHTIAVAACLGHWITENAKSTRAFLKRVNAAKPLSHPIQSMDIQELPRAIHKKGDHTAAQTAGFDTRKMLAPALAGHDMGLVSEAGMPAIADPGSSIVRTAHSLQIPVEVLTGPVSMVMALAGSGLNGQSFAFVGYLPQELTARVARIRELESVALKMGQTQIFIETPYRNAAMLEALLHSLRPTTWLAVSSGLTLPSRAKGNTHQSAPVQQWLKMGSRPDLTLPTVFMIGA